MKTHTYVGLLNFGVLKGLFFCFWYAREPEPGGQNKHTKCVIVSKPLLHD